LIYNARWMTMRAELIAAVESFRTDRPRPAVVKIGKDAYEVLVKNIATKPAAGVSGLQMALTGMPILIMEDWPPNMYAVVDTEGQAITGGILDRAELPADG